MFVPSDNPGNLQKLLVRKAEKSSYIYLISYCCCAWYTFKLSLNRNSRRSIRVEYNSCADSDSDTVCRMSTASPRKAKMRAVAFAALDHPPDVAVASNCLC